MDSINQGIVGCTSTNVPRHGKFRTISPISRGYLWVSYPQESLENTINTMGTLLGVHPSLSLDFTQLDSQICKKTTAKKLVVAFNMFVAGCIFSLSQWTLKKKV